MEKADPVSTELVMLSANILMKEYGTEAAARVREMLKTAPAAEALVLTRVLDVILAETPG